MGRSYYPTQSWFLPYLHITLPSSAATLPKLRSSTVVLNHHHLHHSQPVGLVRKPYSNPSAWNPRVLLPPWKTLKLSMMNLVFQQSAYTVKPNPKRPRRASPKFWSLWVIPRLVVLVLKRRHDADYLRRLSLLHLPKHLDKPAFFTSCILRRLLPVSHSHRP